MARFISKDGKWYPAREKVGLVNRTGKDIKHPITGEIVKAGEPYIYEGPDRDALYELWKAEVEYFGEDFRKSTDFQQMIRNRGFKNEKEYLKFIGFDEKESEEEFEKKAAVLPKDEIKKKSEAIQTLGGGADTSGSGQDRYGGFGAAPDL